MQFIRPDRTNIAVEKSMEIQTPVEVTQIFQSACYDCHSNETKYPWYSNIQPFGWFLKNHIEDGRKHLNFSTFATYEPKRQAHKLFESVEMVENGEMPMESYLLMHPEAKLSESQKAEIVNYFKRIEDEIRVANNLAPEEAKTEKK